MKKKRFEHDYLMPFIDFAFMVIIIFIALLSIAYFTPPGGKGTSVVKVIKPLIIDEESIEKKTVEEKVKEIEYLKTKLKTKRYIYEKVVRTLKDELEKKDKKITQLEKEISILKAQLSKKEKELKEFGYGKHEFSDLRK